MNEIEFFTSDLNCNYQLQSSHKFYNLNGFLVSTMNTECILVFQAG